MRENRGRVLCLSLCGVLLVASSLHGCGADDEAGARSASGSELLTLVLSPRVERVSMEGAGCGSADPAAIRITTVRDSFEIDFEGFTATSQDERAGDVKCTVSVVLDGAEGVAYAPAGLELELDTSVAATVSIGGYWANMPGRRSVDTYTSYERGRYLTRALDDRSLWSTCSGARELRFAVKLGLGSRKGRAEFERLSGLRFYARPCQDGGAEQHDGSTTWMDSGGSNAIDAGDDADRATVDAMVEGTIGDAGVQASPDLDAASPAASFLISSVNVAGTGCPESAAVVRIPDGRDSFDVDFSRFVSEATPERTIRSTYCNLAVDVVVPEGKTIAVERFTAKGAANLPPGSTVRLSAFYDYLGASEVSATKQVALAGPYEGKLELAAEFDEGELLFRRCGDTRPILLHLSMFARSGESADNARATVESLGAVRFAVRDCQ